ncbi:hypothetical protein AB205_0129770 [Aquarana catesbeiana]|uniref:Uncharacterized protein n=1 Tax=Aquarana catesbeiana TaxID=8400 RepID=A0A2G9QFZ6_AQUCT|nr:hypothetical protein AB205_0129770 [Aquarana catesbeiana]
MFHIPISVLKYLCAKYIFCFILIGEKRLGTSEDTSPPPQLLKKGNSGHHNLRMWRKERWKKWLKLSPQQVMCMLWKNKLLISPVQMHKY